MKIQVRGHRRTFALQASNASLASVEALELYRSIVAEAGGEPVGRLPGHERSAPTDPAVRPDSEGGQPRVRLVRRPGVMRASGEGAWSAWLEGEGQGHYFPLETADAPEAARRARRLQAAAGKDGLARLMERHSREATVAIRWCGDPVMWTYFTLYTHPGESVARRRPRVRISSSQRWSIGIVEPDAGLGSALRECLDAQSECLRVTHWNHAAEALGALSRASPDLLLVNHSLEGISGAEFLARLQLLSPHLAARVYSVSADSDELFKSTPGGAAGYLLRRTAQDRILEPLGPAPLKGVHGATGIHPSVQRYFQQLIGTQMPSGGSFEMARLTPRELEILSLMAKGFLDKEIAHDLRISAWTVHGHAKKIFEKLSVHSRTEAVVRYLQK